MKSIGRTISRSWHNGCLRPVLWLIVTMVFVTAWHSWHWPCCVTPSTTVTILCHHQPIRSQHGALLTNQRPGDWAVLGNKAIYLYWAHSLIADHKAGPFILHIHNLRNYLEETMLSSFKYLWVPVFIKMSWRATTSFKYRTAFVVINSDTINGAMYPEDLLVHLCRYIHDLIFKYMYI